MARYRVRRVRMNRIPKLLAWALAAGLALQVALAQPSPPNEIAVSAERIRADVKHLASDRMEGRGIGTLGEERAIEFIAEELGKAGLKPAGERGTFFQTVPLIGVTTGPKASLSAVKGQQTIDFALEEEFVGTSYTQQSEDFDA